MPWGMWCGCLAKRKSLRFLKTPSWLNINEY
jgi:hypothetical protein